MFLCPSNRVESRSVLVYGDTYGSVRILQLRNCLSLIVILQRILLRLEFMKFLPQFGETDCVNRLVTVRN